MAKNVKIDIDLIVDAIAKKQTNVSDDGNQSKREARTNSANIRRELAKRIGLSKQTLSSWNCGNVPDTIKSLVTMSEMSGLKIDEFVREENGND